MAEALPLDPPFERLAVLGLGLLGGSVASAARTRGAARVAIGCGRNREALRRAQSRGTVDEIETDAAAAVRGADLVVLASPVASMAGLLESAAPGLSPGALITDVGSVKAPLQETLPGLLPQDTHYVGSHPMAGSHLRGAVHARADLFEGAACVVTPSPGSPPEAVERIEAFWRALGARVLRRDPADHDREVAWISHVPHALAFAFARGLSDAPRGACDMVGTGFRDFTRIAQSDPELWADILVTNGKALSGPLRRIAERLAGLARDLEAGDQDAVERMLMEARANLASVRAGAVDDDAGDDGSGAGSSA